MVETGAMRGRRRGKRRGGGRRRGGGVWGWGIGGLGSQRISGLVDWRIGGGEGGELVGVVGERPGQTVKRLRFEGRAFREVPQGHEMGSFGLSGQPLFAQPMDASDQVCGWGGRGRSRWLRFFAAAADGRRDTSQQTKADASRTHSAQAFTGPTVQRQTNSSQIKVFQGNPDNIKPVLALRRKGYFLRKNQPNIFPARSSENPSLRFSPEYRLRAWLSAQIMNDDLAPWPGRGRYRVDSPAEFDSVSTV